MLFHLSSRESEIKTLYGITDDFGVSFLELGDKHRILVEQEERCHGMFLGCTEHGRTILTLGKLSLEPHSFLDQVLTVRPRHSKVVSPGRARFLARSHRQRLLDESRVAHEVLAKYMSFIRYGAIARVDQYGTVSVADREERISLWLEAVNDYPLLAVLGDRLGTPEELAPESRENIDTFAFYLGKWVFATHEFEQLEAHRSLESLGEVIASGAFVDPISPTLRLTKALAEIPKEKWASLISAIVSGYEQQAFLSAMSVTVPHLRTPRSFDSFSEMVRRSFVIGRNIGLSFGIFSQQSPTPFTTGIDSNGVQIPNCMIKPPSSRHRAIASVLA